MAMNQPEEREPVSFRFRKTINDKLSELSQATGRSKTFLAEEALEHYCDLQSWQVRAIQKGMADAQAGRVTPHEDVKAQWMKKRENSMG
jgi:RHH-type transcriptional regulator, rel operon repressor / antitoxin RelB